MIWENVIQCKDNIIKMLNNTCTEYQEEGITHFEKDGWISRTWRNENIRRAHVNVVDARKTKGLLLCHICVFPELNNNGPIYGFDMIAGENKITGAFHDFSSLYNKPHPLTDWFIESTKQYRPSKPRELPEWARAIFSPGMIAAGNIQEEKELKQMYTMAEDNLAHYLANIDQFGNTEDDVKGGQNFYCSKQRENPHNPRVMQSLGLTTEEVASFIDQHLFPIVQ